MVAGRLVASEDVEVIGRELILESGEDIVEGESVSGKVDPSRVSGELSEGSSWPETIRLLPDGEVRLEFLHVLGHSLDVEVESGSSLG